MQFLSSLTVLARLAATSLAVASCPAATTCKGLTSLAASALKGYAPAGTFCTKKFPIPRRTCADTAVAITISATVGTTTITTTVATAMATVTALPITTTVINTEASTMTTTSTSTQVATETVMITTTVNYPPAKAKRSQPSARAVDPRASKLSSLTSQASSLVGAVCTCLEVPASTTITTTPTSTSSITITATSSVTATTTATVTPTITVTTIITVAPTTVTATATASTTTTTTIKTTETAAPGTCVAPDFGRPYDFCNDGSFCDYVPERCYIERNGPLACKATCAGNPCSITNEYCVIYSSVTCCESGSAPDRRSARAFKRAEAKTYVKKQTNTVFFNFVPDGYN